MHFCSYPLDLKIATDSCCVLTVTDTGRFIWTVYETPYEVLGCTTGAKPGEDDLFINNVVPELFE